MRKTKIICTIGPSSEDPAVFREMCVQGLNVARLNFSHGTHAEHQQKIDMIKSVREELNLPIAIMLDTKGPEYRIRTFKNGKVSLKDGDDFTFTTREVEGDKDIVSVSYKGLADDLDVGDRILVNNGLVIFEVREIQDGDIHCRVLTGGVLSDRKSMSFPGKVMKQVYLSAQDKSDLLFGIENEVDFVAASFVSCKQDLIDLRTFLNEHNGKNIDVIAKIENQSGVDNIEEICTACEGIMVARGDLGVEVPFTELPAIQKYLIGKCRMLGKRVITATEMLESMITNAEETERHIDYAARFQTQSFSIRNRVDAISHAACTMAIDLDAKAIIVTSLSGLTVRMVSRFRAPITILGLATGKKAWYKLALSWGVIPMLTEQFPSMDVLNYFALREAKEVLHLQAGDTVVMTGGNTSGESGNTNMIRIETVA